MVGMVPLRLRILFVKQIDRPRAEALGTYIPPQRFVVMVAARRGCVESLSRDGSVLVKIFICFIP
jgi:hypothetical protein